MAFDGNGNYNPPAPEYPLQPQTVISSADMNTLIQDIANALGNCMTRDSQGAPSVDLNLFTKKIVNLGAATNPNDAMRKVDVETYAITATTDRDMAGYRLKNLPASPVAGTDAVSANYVNTAQADRSMDGHHLVGAPTAPYAADEYVPKQYVNDQDALRASLTGATYTGTHDFTGGTALVTTQGPTDSTTKAASTAFVQSIAMNTALPGLAGNALKTLRVNAGETTAEWELGLPTATGNEGKALTLDSAAAPKWANPPRTWSNWTLITTHGGTLTIPDLVNEIRAYTFGKGGNGALAAGGGGGGGGGCTYGTIPCKPGDVFTFDITSGAVLKKGATAYLTANNGSNGAGSTGGAGGAAGTVGGGLGITASGAYAGGAGGNGVSGSYSAGAGGSSGSPLGTGKAGGAGTTTGAGGGGWGAAGNEYGGGGVGSLVATAQTLSGAYAVNGEAASRDWSNAFTDPLLLPCNAAVPISGFGRLVATIISAFNAGPGTGGGRTNTGGASGGAGGLGGGGGQGMTSSGYDGGNGGFGGGGGTAVNGSSTSGNSGSGGIGGGGAGAPNASPAVAGQGGAAAVLIFW